MTPPQDTPADRPASHRALSSVALLLAIVLVAYAVWTWARMPREQGAVEIADYAHQVGEPFADVPRYEWTTADGTTVTDRDVAWFRCEQVTTTNFLRCDVMSTADGSPISPNGFQDALDTGVLHGGWVDPSTCYLVDDGRDLECRIHWPSPEPAQDAPKSLEPAVCIDAAGMPLPDYIEDCDLTGWDLDGDGVFSDVERAAAEGAIPGE